MIQRIVHTVLTLICIISVTNQNHAGVITEVDNGIVTKYTTNDGTKVQFVNASFNTLTSGSNPGDVMPWFNQANTATETYGPDLIDDLNDYSTVQLDINIYYLFANKTTTMGKIQTALTYYDNGAFGKVWDGFANDFEPTATTDNGNPLYYAILDTGSDVPEPSTAIAMGLLGIVGFAGNRRRRRQESVA